MEYNKIKDFDKYKSVFDHKVAQLRRPQERQALVIFFDGKNATKHHNHDMLSRESFTRWMVRSIRSILRGYQGAFEIYAIIDEITVIFHDSEEIAKYLNEDCIDSIYGLLISRFTLEFNKHIPCAFKGAAYFTSDIAAEINYRKSIGHYTALEYYAKEYMESKYYHNKTESEIIESLKEHKLYDAFVENKAFRNGLYFSSVQK